MKRLTLLITAMILATQIFAQNITADTTLANKYFETATTFKDSTQYDSAIVYFKKASLLYEKHKQWRKYLQSQTTCGQCYQKIWKLEQEIAIIKPAIEKTLQHLNEGDTIIADAYHTLGTPYYYLSKFDSILLYWRKELNIREKLLGEKNIRVASLYNDIGIILDSESEYDKALVYLFKGLERFKKLFGEQNFNVATAYGNIGILYRDKDEYDKALEYYFKNLEIYKKLLGEKNVDVARIYNNIGAVYFDKAKYDTALKYYFKSLKIRKELLDEKNIDLAVSYANIGIAYAYISEYKKALEYQLKALEMQKKLLGEKNVDVARSYNNVGFVYWKKSKYDKALEYYFKALKIQKELLGEKNIYVVNSYNNIGNVYRNKLEYDKALKYYQLGIVAELRDFNDTADITKVPVIQNYIEHKYLLKVLRNKAEILSDTDQKISGFTKTERFELALRYYQAADTLISQARKNMTTKSDKLALGEQANKIYKEAVKLCINLAKSKSSYDYNKLAFYFSEKNKSSVLLEALAGEEALKFSGIPDTLLKQEHKLSIDITNYKNLKNKAKNDSIVSIWDDRLFKANRSYDSLITVFETQYPKYYNLKYNNSPTTVERISNLLNKKTVILSYSIGDSTITIFALSKKDFRVTQVPKPDSLDKQIRNYRYNISDTRNLKDEMLNGTHKSVAKYQKLAFQFYNLLFPPKIQSFLSKKVKNLIIIPDGELATLPFETLLTKKYNAKWTGWESISYFAQTPYLVKDYNISYSYSATLFQQTIPKQKSKKVEVTPLNDWIAFAPVFDDKNTAGTTALTRKLLTVEKNDNDSLVSRSYLTDGNYVSPLPGSEKEVKAIFNLYNRKGEKALIKTHKQAGEAFVKSDKMQNYRIIHFATHGFVNEKKPELSFILLAQDTSAITKKIYGGTPQQNEGFLYQSEIYNLKFNADLVVLSACETGLGEIKSGEGVIGLTRALLYAGTKNLIVSLWQVSDNSTKELMIYFYRNLLNNQKQNKFAKYLSDAKRQMIKSGRYAHPFYWSPFILIGE